MRNKKGIKRGVEKILALTLSAAMMLTVFSFSALASPPNKAYDGDEKGVEERFKLAEQLGVLEYMESDGYLYEGYTMSLSFYEMTELIEILRFGDMDEILVRDQGSIERVYMDLESKMAEGVELIESYYITSYSQVNHSSNGFAAGKYMGYTPAGVVDLFCGNNAASSPPAGTALTNITQVTNENVLKALYYGYNGPEAIESASIDFYIETANAISEYLYENGYSQSVPFREAISQMDIPPNGFTAYISTTNGGSTQPMLFSMYEPQGTLSIKKVSSIPSFTNGSESYSLWGAVYGVYDSKSDSTLSGKIGELTVTQSGDSNQLTVDAGTYYIQELSAPRGYKLDTNIYTVEVKSDALNTYTVENMPFYDTQGLVLKKVDAESGMSQTSGMGSLEGAQFTVKFYNTHGSINGLTPSRTWVFETDKEGIIEYHEDYKTSGDTLYYYGEDSYLPLGTITIEETKAPVGYLLDTNIYTRKIELNESQDAVELSNVPVVMEQIVRGDIDLIKIEDTTMKRMEGIPFAITSTTTGESHIIITDENGYASTHSNWNAHGKNTNRGETCEDGVWFGDISAISEEKGALPFDSYMIEELPCDNNAEHNLFPPFMITISRNNYTVSLGTITNDMSTVTVTMDTVAREAYTGSQSTEISDEMCIDDGVILAGLTPGLTYTIQGVLMDKSTNSELLVYPNEPTLEDEMLVLPYEKINLTMGESVTSDYTFVAQSPWEEHTVSFNFNGSLFEETKDLVVFEYLYLEDEVVVEHTDINDKDQTVEVVVPLLEEVLGERIEIVEESAPKTGDETQIMFLLLILASSIIGGGILWVKREK